MMYQWQEKGERSRHNHPEAALDILHMLESPDPDTVESAQNMIQENLCGSKDPRLLNGLVDYYLTVKSKKSLNILLRLKDPHDKHLFDKISELMKNENSRYESLQLLSNIIYKQPTWLHKIANHRIMTTLLCILKSDVNAPNLMSGLFVLICLLPLIPSKFGPFLLDTFEVFSRLASWHVKKPSSMMDIYILHLQIGIYSLFHRLYGMFPCNFLAYLRSYYGGRDINEDNFKVFSLVIKPMLDRVRLHHLLVTASKETELSANRWKKMDYHDIIVDCASISLDAIEGTNDGIKRRTDTVVSASVDQNLSNHDSGQFVSFSSQSSTSTNMESDSLVTGAMTSHSNAVWSPSHAVAVTTPPPTTSGPLPHKGEWDAKNYSMQLPGIESIPLDIAVEAKPEVLRSELDHSNTQTLTFKATEFPALNSSDISTSDISILQGESSKTTFSNETKLSVGNSKKDDTILSASEVKEDDVDKEVSELTSSQNNVPDSTTDNSSADLSRNYTPFCCTTQNLTAEPTPETAAARSGSLPKSTDEDTMGDEMYNSLQDADMEASFLPSFSRLRYFSHCGPPPNIPPVEPIRKPKAVRSVSCPAQLCPMEQSSSCEPLNSNNQEVVVTCCSSVITTSGFVPVLSTSIVSSQDRPITYHDLIPLAVGSDVRRQSSASFGLSYSPQNTYLGTLSPPELLDHYIQLGSGTCLNELGIPITSSKGTDWTHFGGKPPPDEVTILRNQMKLLHCQLLFERHRKDVHSERNRSILGRSKRSRMQEDHIAALQEQITLLEQDNQSLKNELSYQSKLYHQLTSDKQQTEIDFNNKVCKTEQENIQLLYSNKKLQNLLVSQKEENNEIREGYKKSHSEVENLRLQLEVANKEVMRCTKLEKDAIFLSKQLMLMQELNSHLKDKIEQMKNPPVFDYGEDLYNAAAYMEIKDLKQKLDSKSHILEVSKAKISELEQSVSSMKTKQKEQMLAFEKVKSLNKNDIMVREERLADMRKVSIQKDAHILDLNKNIETLSERIRNLESMLVNNGATGINEQHEFSDLNTSVQTNMNEEITDQKQF